MAGLGLAWSPLSSGLQHLNLSILLNVQPALQSLQTQPRARSFHSLLTIRRVLSLVREVLGGFQVYSLAIFKNHIGCKHRCF